MTTSHTIEGEEIDEYLGVVIADITPGRHVGKDFLAGLRNFFGGRSRSWEKTLREVEEKGIDKLVERAKDLGADDLVSLEVEDETIGSGGMMNVKVIATAVKFK